VEADAGKTRGAIKRLLIEHGRIRQKAKEIGKVALAGKFESSFLATDFIPQISATAIDHGPIKMR
jgi:hypothetical protein